MNVLHISQTPLVAAPQKISSALNTYTDVHSNCLVVKDYEGSKANIFSDQSLIFHENDYIYDVIEKSDVIHIHNDIEKKISAILKEVAKEKVYIYQTHSYLREGPLYYDRSEYLPFDFKKKLVIAQYQPRVYPEFTMVPNLILHDASYHENWNNPVKILYSPAQRNTYGRWGTKYSSKLEKVLIDMENNDNVQIITASGVHPNELYRLRKTADITIDEIFTGGFHQISLEGLCAGNAVINAADFFSLEIARAVADRNETPPFVFASESNIEEVLLDLINNRHKLNSVKKQSYDFFVHNLDPKKLINKYVDIYKSATS